MKEHVLEALQNSGAAYVSGEQLSEILGVSRTMIWKIINQLKSDGYVIESSSRKGYRLSGTKDLMSQTSLGLLFKQEKGLHRVEYHDAIDSTNLQAKRLALQSDEDRVLIVADQQNAGRGRLGRNWHSEKGTGLWLSLLLKPEIEPEISFRMTLIAAVAVSEAIEKTTGLKAGIKWPNDIIVNGKKVCGILSEMSAEWQKINYIVLGIGINVNQEAFPDDIVHIATSLMKESGSRVNRLELLKNCVEAYLLYEQALYSEEMLQTLLEVYRKRSVTLGQVVRVIGKEERIGTALEIDDKGALLVAFDNGNQEYVNYGEVSVRGIDYYA